MFELFQIVWDLFMVRRSARNGQFNLRKGVIAAALCDKHSEQKPLFIAAMVLGAADVLLLIALVFYWWRQWAAPQF